MKGSINHLVYQVVARECDHSAEKRLDEIWESSKRSLDGMGIPSKLFSDLDVQSKIEPYFIHRFIPNPLYWSKYFRSRFTFFLIRAQSKRYQTLLTLLQGHMPTVSFFVCYGEIDVIVRVIGDEQVIEQVEDLLINNGFPPSIIKVEDVPLFYDITIDKHKALRKPDLAPEIVDDALASRPQDISPDLTKELEDSGIVLGTVYFEDSHVTGRIRTFVGIKFNALLPRRQLAKFERALIEINDKEKKRRGSRPLSSIYRCGGHFAYLLEMIFDDQEQLDWVTDQIQDIDPNVGDTETLILAKAIFAPISFSERAQGEPGKYAVLRHVFDQKLLPLSQRLFENWPELESVFIEASPESQFEVLSLYHDLVERNLKLGEISHPLLDDYIAEFIRGILEGKVKRIQNAGLGLIRDVVEEEHKELVRIVLNKFFDGKTGELQKALKSDNDLWEKWGLAKWAKYLYPVWNRNRIYSAILKVPDDVTRSLLITGGVRNRLAHDAHVGEMDALVTQVREAFHHTYKILAWLNDAKVSVQNPHVPLQIVREIAVLVPESKQFELLSSVKISQEEIIDLLIKLKNQSDERWHKLASMIEEIQLGEAKIDERTQTMIQELVIPQIKERERKKAQRVLDYLMKTSGSIPSEVIVTIISGLIARALGLP